MREELDRLVEKFNLIERTFDGFWYAFDSYLKKYPIESKEVGFFSRDSVSVELSGYSFCVTNELDFDCIKVYMDIFLKGETVSCGDYWCIYSLDGDEFDDYFVID